MQGRFRYWLHL